MQEREGENLAYFLKKEENWKPFKISPPKWQQHIIFSFQQQQMPLKRIIMVFNIFFSTRVLLNTAGVENLEDDLILTINNR